MVAGIDAGELQRLRGNVATWAGLAAAMAAGAGWWQLELLLSSLSAQAAASARPELLLLLQVIVCCDLLLASAEPDYGAPKFLAKIIFLSRLGGGSAVNDSYVCLISIVSVLLLQVLLFSI